MEKDDSVSLIIGVKEILVRQRYKWSDPVEISLGKSHVFALSQWIVVQNVVIIQ